MRLPGAKAVNNLSRRLRACVFGGALILGYHRVHPVENDVYQLRVSPENFAEQMQVLRRYAHPISLLNLVQSLKQNEVPPKSVAVTFDDGYADNLYVAKPVLEAYGIPATVFICTGYLGREFWWDELERLVVSAQADERVFSLRLGKAQFEWIPPRAKSGTGSPVQTQFHRALYHFLLRLDIEERNRGMELIRSWSHETSHEITTARAMSEAELIQLVDGGLIEIGAHTRHHPMLPQLSVGRQKEEIHSSRRDLEGILGREISGFSYPNGRATDDTKRLVRETGFTYGCTSMHDVVRPESDLFELTRFWQQNDDGNTFMKALSQWMRVH